MLKAIIGLIGLVIYAVVIIFVIRDSYFKHRFNLMASILWIALVIITPLSLGFPLYLLFRPNRNLKQNSALCEPNEVFLRKKYQILDAVFATLLFITLTGIFFMLLKVIPAFAEIFKGFNIELPALTKVLIEMSTSCRKYFFIVSPLTVILAIPFFLICRVFLRKYLPTSYLIAIISYFILHGLLIGLMVICMFWPIIAISSIR